MGLLSFYKRFFSLKNNKAETIDHMKKYLIVGLGNIGEKYTHTRHNVGFKVAEVLADKFGVAYQSTKLGDVAKFNHKGRTFVVLKPSTYMNLSGKAVRYWMIQENIPIENILVVGDDISIVFECEDISSIVI